MTSELEKAAEELAKLGSENWHEIAEVFATYFKRGALCLLGHAKKNTFMGSVTWLTTITQAGPVRHQKVERAVLLSDLEKFCGEGE